jgi:hypothetical protein
VSVAAAAAGQLRPYGKTTDALRVVPLAEKALEALDAHPARY